MEAAMLVYILEGMSTSIKYTGTADGLFSPVQMQTSFAELAIANIKKTAIDLFMHEKKNTT